ncbi:MAG TPA: radical SAM protein [Rectinemataceae bacterium]|nr:radical SAM protein [Rectinemataceae bacterium]
MNQDVVSPRLPLEGSLDLTYRCNNACAHCWVRLPADAPERRDELSPDEYRRIIDDARSYGCRRWSFTGGEPMLRPDFTDIFEYATAKATGYSLNTNGTFITPKIAQTLKKKGVKMIALYGASPEGYAAVTGNPDGFDAAMRGFAYMKEAGTGFIVQLIPMAANWHEWDKMKALAAALSPHWRVGAAWLYLSADGSPESNRRIEEQRLPPRVAVELDHHPPALGESDEQESVLRGEALHCGPGDDRLYARCIENRREFCVDAYGSMSWCAHIKDPSLRYNLREGSFAEGWENFIPSCADRVRGGEEWREGCGSCAKRAQCRWCAAYGYLETGRHSAKVPYLCAVADKVVEYNRDWNERHRRFFRVAGITVCVESELDLRAASFKRELAAFEVDGPGEDTVELSHYFGLPDLGTSEIETEVYRRAPWAISRRSDGSWLYRGISPSKDDQSLHRIALFTHDMRKGTIYSPQRDRARIEESGWQSLSLFPTDQIWLAPLLADREAVLIHSAAAVVGGSGFVFVGHSEAGKSTTMELLKTERASRGLDATVLCDDRNVVRHFADSWRVYGTWSHGTTSDVSPESAPLRAILFLKQDGENRIVPLSDKKEIWKRLLVTLIRAAVNAEWWQKELDILERIVTEVPCYVMRFDKSGAIVREIEALATE